MKRFISILLVAVMLVAMIPAGIFTASATETTFPTTKWTDAGNYDISWASELITATATNGQSVTVNGTIYTIKYPVKTYEIDTPQKLAGIAVLANAGNIESFSGTIFKITKDIDLSAHLWEPIANNSSKKFRGLITADSEAVITGMTIVDSTNNGDNCYGLVGNQGGGQANNGVATGSITNITLKNATINVVNGYVGSFVGRITYGGVDYKGLKSDAKIVCSTGKDASGKYVVNSNAWNAVGGICGRVDGWGQLNQKFSNCVFTGSLDTPTVSCVGGIVGVDRRNSTGDVITFEKCVVSAEFIHYGAERPGGYNAWYGGCGGIMGCHIASNADTSAGSAEADHAVLNECYVSIGEFTIYAEQDTPSNPHEGVGGMVGNQGNADIAFTNCQIDMLTSSGLTSSHHGAFVGRNMGATTYTNCVNTSVFARVKGASWDSFNTYSWSARNPGITNGGGNFGAFYQRLGHDVNETATVITSVSTWKNTLNRRSWSERTDSIYPILNIAKNYTTYSPSGAGLDYSFFKMNGSSTYMTVKTVAQLEALYNIYLTIGSDYGSILVANSGTSARYVNVASELATADMSDYEYVFKAGICAKLGIPVEINPEGKWTDKGNYDLSWAEPLVTATAKDGESCTIDGKIYTLKNHVGTYEIDTPEKLAGVALLANSVPGESFSGTVFKITKTIDLSAHFWEPIGKDSTHKFRGTITSDSFGVIAAMTISDTASTTDSCYGLVGCQGSGQANDGLPTGTISNIALVSASINVTNGYVGSFVGRITYGGVDYENIKSDAKIVCSSGMSGNRYVEHGNAWNAVGGICGRVDGWGELNQRFVGCVFTGSIDAPTASCVGGIVGVDRRGDISTLTINKCVVSSEFIRYGAYRPGGEAAWYGGCGGFVGADINADGGTTAIKESYVAIGEFTIYPEQNSTGAGHDGTANAIGNCNDCELTNVQVDMAVAAENGRHHGAFVGRGMGTVTFTSCVHTGVTVRIKGAGWCGADSFNWHARNPGYVNGGNNYATFAQRLVYGTDDDAPTVITSASTWKGNLDSTVWSERTNCFYPILAIAKDYSGYSVSYPGTDYKFFNVNGCRVSTESHLRALSYIVDAMGSYGSSLLATSGANANRVIITAKSATLDMSKLKDSTADLFRAELGISENFTSTDSKGELFNMSKSFMQVSTDETAVRFAILTSARYYANMTFNVAISYVDDSGVVRSGVFTQSEKIKDAYKSVVDVKNNKTYTAATEGGSDQWVYVVFTVKNLPKVLYGRQTTFTVFADAHSTDGTTTVRSLANNYTITPSNPYLVKNGWSVSNVTGADRGNIILRTVNIDIPGTNDPIEIFQITDVHFNAVYKDSSHTTMVDDWNTYGSITSSGETTGAMNSWNEWGDLVRADGTYASNAKILAAYKRCINYAANADRIMITGDIINFYSQANLDLMEKYVFNAKTNVNSSMTAKIIAMAGNHEPAVTPYNKNTLISNANSVSALYTKYGQNMKYSSEVIDGKVMIVQMDNGASYDVGNIFDSSVGRFTQDQVNKLTADIATAKANGYTLLLFFHVPMPRTSYGEGQGDLYGDGTNVSDGVGGWTNTAVDKAMYNLITNNADTIRGCFTGHTHSAYVNQITAKTSDGKDAYIPQYTIEALYERDGEMLKIVLK